MSANPNYTGRPAAMLSLILENMLQRNHGDVRALASACVLAGYLAGLDEKSPAAVCGAGRKNPETALPGRMYD